MTGAALPAKDIATLSGAHSVERAVRLSTSKLWQAQRDYFTRVGRAAWSSDTVPHYITSNPSIAASYAEVVLAFLRDCDAQGQLDRSRPVHIVELGSGSGRFAFYLLNRLRSLIAGSLLAGTSVRYVLTDFAPGKLDVLKGHPALKEWIEEGTVDFACVDVMAPGPITLEQSGEKIGSRSKGARSPVVLISNYVLDSVPQDCFMIRQGELHEGLLTVTAPSPDADLADPAMLEKIVLNWQPRPIGERYYGNEAYDRILADYRDVLDDTSFLFPAAMLDCARRMVRDASGPVLWIAADKGYGRAEDLLGQDEPNLVLHGGAFSLMVNFDAVRRYVIGDGGQAFHPRHRPLSLVVAAYLMQTGGAPFVETAHAYSDCLADGGPDDFFAVKTLVRPGTMTMSAEQMLAYLRFTHWDSAVFLECFSPLLDLAPSIPDALKPDVAMACRRVADNYFWIGEETDVHLCLGLILSGIHYFRESLPYFESSIALRGPTANAFFGLAVSHYGLRDLETGLRHAREALGLEPGFSGARSLKATIEAQLAAPSR